MRTALVAALLIAASPALIAADGLVVHEWGTFTSLLADDGGTTVWTAAPTPLPAFVHRGPFGKYVAALQRIETPVIYLHVPRPMEVLVEVDAAQGHHSEWYPAAVGTGAEGRLSWRVRARPDAAAILPGDAEAGAYSRARAADAALIESLDAPDERERFLFYRGLASFPSPVRARVAADGWRLENSSPDPIGPLLIIATAAGRTRWSETPVLASGEQRTVALATADSDAASAWAALGERLRIHLAAAGLNPDEAAAMVATWHEWGSEDGVRVLTLLPPAFADRALPLRITPVPDAVVRTLVGRAELATPERVARLVAALTAGDAAGLAADRFALPILRLAANSLPAAPAAKVREWVLEQERRVLQPARSP